ncbi:MAG: Holliday junction resolvase RuvX [Lachnospiraceae bacterium]|nr:Holliday junction resolvase RuvX [Lachnospiraceae bacterium]
MRLMGLDFGSVTVGVAVSDSLGITAQEVETITRKHPDKLRQTYARIEALASEYDVEKIILGFPVNMNNTEGFRAIETKKIQEDLARRTNLPVVMWDERLTTVEADRILEECNVAKKNRKKYIDQVAAAIILQNYMDSVKNGN